MKDEHGHPICQACLQSYGNGLEIIRLRERVAELQGERAATLNQMLTNAQIHQRGIRRRDDLADRLWARIAELEKERDRLQRTLWMADRAPGDGS